MSRRPRIVVSAPSRGGRAPWLFTRALVCGAGGRAIRVRPGRRRPAWSEVDGLILSGGVNVAPEHYGAEMVADDRLDPERDALELELLAGATERGLPVLGICRGMQLLNVARGGSLHADLRAVYPGHSPRVRLHAHKHVEVETGSLLARTLEATSSRVNSIHRQGVDRVGEGLRVSARDRLGVVQAVEEPDAAFCVGVQWHPELMPWQRAQRRLFRSLVDAARGGAAHAPVSSASR